MTLFSKIIAKEIPADIVYEDDDMMAFRDINPVAPVHLLLIPKEPMVNLLHVEECDGIVLGKMMTKAGAIAKAEGLDDFRIVVNNGAGVGQTVFHLHLHILGGRDFSWPPG